ncbi:aminotransferase class I/II-fold pyridoxal phosphate-dependent enzyme [Bifidobacterium sp. ESL0764]|uniref:aminotransferase class I/II-fold pyridoxal phosphate-dependent enzyme n=1 Tax=Bifidobacterium sp. ESL0764 TaxID=2983228 RepID=UPI0023F8AB37|nr:aminotransferase class I/II-fold pyridoxal phosphate-dependent enzyme [Bifidobacterium sp. ESL0764]WEV65489.1 aminotransferase class I/II-fold pyridoxal phosphate-dependent enzyme [Bifidobacterium sp. ESL0764]
MGFYRFDSPYDWNRVTPYKKIAAQAGGGMIDFSVGSPVDPVPASVQQALADGADAPNAHGYPTVAGTETLRKSVSEWFRANRGVDFAAIDADFVPTVGSKEAVALMASLLHFGPGDVIVQPAVSYPTYDIGTQLAGAKTYKAADIADVDSWCSIPGVKAVWVNSPCNPTGEVLSAEELHGIVKAAREIGAVVLSDECYGLLTWAGDENGGDDSRTIGTQNIGQPNGHADAGKGNTAAVASAGIQPVADMAVAAEPADSRTACDTCRRSQDRATAVPQSSDTQVPSDASGRVGTVASAEPAPAPCMLQPDVCDGSARGILVLYSLSKQSNMAGYRTALIAGDPELVRPMTVYRKQIGEIIPGPIQAAMAAALHDTDAVRAQHARYSKRLRQLVGGLRAAGYDARMPQGALYVWTRARSGDCWQDMDDLARLGIIASPGEFYGDPTHLRFSATAPDAAIVEAVARLSR